MITNTATADNSRRADAAHGIHRIDIACTAIGSTGPRYRVRHTGTVIVESSRDPATDGARALLARGLCGRFEMWAAGEAHARVRGDIERAAGIAVREGDRGGPAFEKFRAMDWDAVSHTTGNAPAAVSVPAAIQPPKTTNARPRAAAAAANASTI